MREYAAEVAAIIEQVDAVDARIATLRERFDEDIRTSQYTLSLPWLECTQARSGLSQGRFYLGLIAERVPSDTPKPRSDNYAALCLGEAVTVCCGAYATFDQPENPEDAQLCCKACWREVGLER